MRNRKMPLGYSYLRWSSPQQAEGDTLRRQTKATEAWCQRNGAQLDETLRLVDAGVSAFHGSNLADPDVHALAGFHAAVRSGRVPKGSFLICESFDRLSRDHWKRALPPIFELINAGIRLVQLVPEQIVDEHSEEWAVVGMIMTLARGRNESVTKSNRVGSAWENKREQARKQPAAGLLTRRVPGWFKRDPEQKLILVGGKPVIDPAAADTVRRVFVMAREGCGVHAIAKQLNADRAPVLGRTKIKIRNGTERAVAWNETVVYHLLKSRATFGEYQPHKGIRGNAKLGRTNTRVPVGEAIQGYYPAVITRDEWDAVQGCLKTRTRRGSGRRGAHVNLFAGLLVDARDGGSFTYKHLKTRGSALIPVGAKHGRGSVWSSFPATPFEAGILSELKEVSVADVEGENLAARKVEVLAGRIAELDGLIRAWTAKMDNRDIVDTVAAKLAELNGRRKKLAGEMADAQRDAANPLSEAWGEARGLLDLFDRDKSDEMRVRIRAAFRRSIDSVTCLFTGVGRVRVAAARVQFHGSDKHRDYVVVYNPGRSNHKVKRVGSVQARSFAELKIGNLDLRNAKHIAHIEKTLKAIDVNTFVAESEETQ